MNRDKIFSTITPKEFEELALEQFRYQSSRVAAYARYIELIGVDPTRVEHLGQIPFLPISLFKNQEIYTEVGLEPQAVFTSSGTTGAQTSRHPVADLSIYEDSFTEGFRHFYGDPAGYSIFALLPSYMERHGSSLTYMVEKLQSLNGSRGGFFLYDHADLASKLQQAALCKERILLIGVTFALVDFAKSHQVTLPEGSIVMETGGMKGREREIERTELHKILTNAFGISSIHSEYGMTELLSQAYSVADGRFNTPPWMRVLTRDLLNPFTRSESGSVGGIDVIDLANRFSCSFISTGDQGILYSDGSFEIMGRIEGEILRGCNMLA